MQVTGAAGEVVGVRVSTERGLIEQGLIVGGLWRIGCRCILGGHWAIGFICVDLGDICSVLIISRAVRGQVRDDRIEVGVHGGDTGLLVARLEASTIAL